MQGIQLTVANRRAELKCDNTFLGGFRSQSEDDHKCPTLQLIRFAPVTDVCAFFITLLILDFIKLYALQHYMTRNILGQVPKVCRYVEEKGL